MCHERTDRQRDRQTDRQTDRPTARTSRLCGARSGLPQLCRYVANNDNYHISDSADGSDEVDFAGQPSPGQPIQCRIVGHMLVCDVRLPDGK